MLKLLLSLYFTCYFCYIFYTREPDYFDGEIITATIKIDGKSNKATAHYFIASKEYVINANYPLRQLKDEESLEIIYNPSKPKIAAVYSYWGYWFTWGELLMSIILLIALYQLSVSIIQNPNEESTEIGEPNENIKPKKYL